MHTSAWPSGRQQARCYRHLNDALACFAGNAAMLPTPLSTLLSVARAAAPEPQKNSSAARRRCGW